MFVPKKDHEFLNLARSVYGFVQKRDLKLGVISIEMAEQVLEDLWLKRAWVTTEWIERTLVTLRTHNVAETTREFYQKLVEAELPDGFQAEYEFVLHNGCGFDLPHGDIVRTATGVVVNEFPLVTVREVFDHLLNMENVDAHQRLAVFKSAVQNGLATDEVTLRESAPDFRFLVVVVGI